MHTIHVLRHHMFSLMSLFPLANFMFIADAQALKHSASPNNIGVYTAARILGMFVHALAIKGINLIPVVVHPCVDM